MNNTDVVVTGGGIGGLAAAYALARSGFSVRVLEKAGAFGEVGAGLQLAPNATRVLGEWGLLDEVVAAGVLPGRVVLGDAVTGAELSYVALGDRFLDRYGAPYVVVHRSDLHSVLLKACGQADVELETGRTVERVDSTADTAFTYCADGSVHESRIALAADGLTSTLRKSIVDDEPICSGYVAYRGTIPASELPSGANLDDVFAWVGPRCHFVRYPLRGGEIVNQVAVFASPAYERGEADWGGPEELDAAFAGCADHVRDGLRWLWRDRRWPMYDRLPTENWVTGRLSLIGDAAHPMLQYLAQGACQAIEDAYALAEHAESAPDWDAALRQFTKQRASRTAQVQTNARAWGEIWHVDGIGRILRNEFLSQLADVHPYMDWLYGR